MHLGAPFLLPQSQDRPGEPPRLRANPNHGQESPRREGGAVLCPAPASASLESSHLLSDGANSRGQGTIQRKGRYQAPGGCRPEGIGRRHSSPGTSAPHSQVCPPETPKCRRGRLPGGDSAPGWHHGETRQNARDQPFKGQTLSMERGNRPFVGAPSAATQAAPRGGGLLSLVARDQCQLGIPPEEGQVDRDPSRSGGQEPHLHVSSL